MSTLEIIIGVGFGFALWVLAFFTARYTLRTRRRLRTNKLIPSDDRRYLGRQARLRLLNAGLMVLLGSLLGGAYVLGIEHKAAALTLKIDQKNAGEVEITPEEREANRQFARVYAAYWICVLVLLFAIVGVALIDLLSTRGYALQQMMRIRKENRQLLERDLALARQHALNDRAKKLKPRGDDSGDSED